ncbi:MAG TPA: helix-turn-helix domain-containing protein, partial [Roseiarcus sp.]|nr:helix-turn-helix domain-containing protein [Roseiarcus sp.]
APKPLLDTAEASKFLDDNGFPVSPATLNTKRSRGGGPKFRRFGPFVRYEPEDLLMWARSKLSEPVANTSEGRSA